jgi:hypothetical protein
LCGIADKKNPQHYGFLWGMHMHHTIMIERFSLVEGPRPLFPVHPVDLPGAGTPPQAARRYRTAFHP